MKSPNKLSTREKVAAAISSGIILLIVIYWVTQIAGVMEMLKRAYG